MLYLDVSYLCVFLFVIVVILMEDDILKGNIEYLFWLLKFMNMSLIKFFWDFECIEFFCFR